MTALPKTLNRPQVIALYALAMELGPECEFTILTKYTIGEVLVEARAQTGLQEHPVAVSHYTLYVEGGSKQVDVQTPKEEQK